MSGAKYDQGKPQWLLLLGAAIGLEGVLKVLEFGAKKYKADSWQQVEDGERRYTEALLRHQVAISKGEFLDPESGLPHAWHVACNAIFIAWFVAKRMENPKMTMADLNAVEKNISAHFVSKARGEAFAASHLGPSFPAGSERWRGHLGKCKPTGIFNDHIVDVQTFGARAATYAVRAGDIPWETVTSWRAAQ